MLLIWEFKYKILKETPLILSEMFNNNTNTQNLHHFALFYYEIKKFYRLVKLLQTRFPTLQVEQVKKKSCQISLVKMVFFVVFFFPRQEFKKKNWFLVRSGKEGLRFADGSRGTTVPASQTTFSSVRAKAKVIGAVRFCSTASVSVQKTRRRSRGSSATPKTQKNPKKTPKNPQKPGESSAAGANTNK